MANEPTRYDTYVPDCLFPTNNQLDIPTLRLDVQPTCGEIPFLCFGEQKRTKDMGGHGTLHFYTDDYRWQSIYEHPEKILKHNPGSIVEPNYSLFNETPMAFGLQAVYKKRWIARTMQDRGIGVYVDLNVANKFYAANLFGVPKANGISVIDQLSELTNLNVVATPSPRESKETRLNAASPFVEAGRVCLVQENWNADFIAEVCGFPAMPHDEYVDLLCYAIDHCHSDGEDMTDDELMKLGFL